jgi:hypothetical protein
MACYGAVSLGYVIGGPLMTMPKAVLKNPLYPIAYLEAVAPCWCSYSGCRL